VTGWPMHVSMRSKVCSRRPLLFVPRRPQVPCRCFVNSYRQTPTASSRREAAMHYHHLKMVRAAATCILCDWSLAACSTFVIPAEACVGLSYFYFILHLQRGLQAIKRFGKQGTTAGACSMRGSGRAAFLAAGGEGGERTSSARVLMTSEQRVPDLEALASIIKAGSHQKSPSSQ
jgi:hypothetical protein